MAGNASEWKWGYEDENGPSTWAANGYPIANGNQQSPIDIVTSQAKTDQTLKQLEISYEEEKDMKISNNGHSVKADISQKSCLKGGPLIEVYRLEQFHLHWGSVDEKGSEHTIDGKTFAAELHLVHWNSGKYKSFGEAVDKSDGLAVLGIMIEVGSEHEGFKTITDRMSEIVQVGPVTKIETGFNPNCLLPANKDYWTYTGSLTTPPLYESVTWIVFKESVQFSTKQMESLRSLNKAGSGKLVDNFRPPQPLKERQLRSYVNSA